MKSIERLKLGDRGTAKDSGLQAKPMPGVVTEVLAKGYRFQVDGEAAPRYFSAKKVRPAKRKAAKPIRPRLAKSKSTSQSLVMPDGSSVPVSKVPLTFENVKRFHEQIILPIIKPAALWRSEAYKSLVRSQPCCNCGAAPPSDPDHVGKRGVSQKCSDALCIPLCRKCHGIRGDKNCLPSPLDSQRKGKTVLRSKAETADLVRQAQAEMLSKALAFLSLDVRIEVLRKAVEAVSEAALSEALR